MSSVQVVPPMGWRSWRRACAAALFVALLLWIGIVVAHLGGVARTFADPDMRLAFEEPYWMLLWGALLYIASLLWGVANRRAALLFCLSLPGAIGFPLLYSGAAGVERGFASAPVVNFLITFALPGACILPIVAIVQGTGLGVPQKADESRGYVTAMVIVALYFWPMYFAYGFHNI